MTVTLKILHELYFEVHNSNSSSWSKNKTKTQMQCNDDDDDAVEFRNVPCTMGSVVDNNKLNFGDFHNSGTEG